VAVALSAARNGVAARPSPVHNGSGVIEYGTRRAVVTLAIVIATLLEIVDVTIVNVALPNIQGNFGASVEQAAWIGTGYIIANVVVIPITPWLQMRFGRRQYYAASIALFTGASLMCGLSGSLSQLVFWRIVQGLGGGGLISTSQAILRETYPVREQGKAQGIFAMGVIVGPTIGPTLGGIITDQLSWRWAFFVNLPLGLLALALVLLFLRNPAPPQKMRLDTIGLGLLAVGVGSLQYVLDQGQQKDWFDDASIVTCGALAVAGIAAFVFWELRSTRPVVDLHVLRYRSVAAGSVLGMVLGISLYGSVLILPQYVQNSLGFTATMSGELLVMRAAAVMLLTPVSATLAMRSGVDTRFIIAAGFVLIGVSNAMLANVTTTDTSFWTFFWPLFIGGVGLSQIFVPLSIAVLGAVAPKDIPGASAFFNLSRQIGGSIAIAVLVTILARSNAVHHAELASQITLASPAVSQYLAAHGGPGPASAAGLNALVTEQAAVLAYADTARATAAITFALVPCVFLLRRPRPTTDAAPALE
jgi:DHA2 family multidrug resistance protein